MYPSTRLVLTFTVAMIAISNVTKSLPVTVILAVHVA